jgi:beta-glucosidase
MPAAPKSPVPHLSDTQASAKARQMLARMTEDEKFLLLRGYVGANLEIPTPMGMVRMEAPAEARQSSGYVPGVNRLGVPPLWETDASMGVANLFNMRPGDVATAFPSTVLLAASFDPELAYRQGEAIGTEAHSKGFNVLLGGGMNLTREPRDGRVYEYLGEDPLLAGIMAGSAVSGTQSTNVISTVKHFALNAQATNQLYLDAVIDEAALRESDLLAFQIAIERGQPGSVMCSYNWVNGEPVCSNKWLLTDVLRRDWKYTGWTMSDWGATRGAEDALAGLDQQSASQMSPQPWFAEPLKELKAKGKFSAKRLDVMTQRILTAIYRVGLDRNPPTVRPIDYAAHGRIAREVAEKGIILLKNEGSILPLANEVKEIAVIGGFANLGVPGGGGSAQVVPAKGKLHRIQVAGTGEMGEALNPILLTGSTPFDALTERLGKANITFTTGLETAEAAYVASKADLAIVFVTRHSSEGKDAFDLSLPMGQDALVSGVAAANPNTIVVVLTGQPVTMPWIDKVKAVVAGFYPGQEGAEALADILTGSINPSGHLPLTFPQSEQQLPRPKPPMVDVQLFRTSTVKYEEGARIGYRWFDKTGEKPLFAFGHGLSYTTFGYSDFVAQSAKGLRLSAKVRNTGNRPGADVVQFYLLRRGDEVLKRLVGFARVELAQGEEKTVEVTVDPRLLASFNTISQKWVVPAADYTLGVAHASDAIEQTLSIKLPESTLNP